MAHFVLGRILFSYDLGILAVDEARRRDPLYLYPALNQAHMLLCLDRPAEALTIMDRLLEADPDFAYGLNEKAMALSELGRLDEAASILERVERATLEGRFREQGLVLLQTVLALERGDASLDVLLQRVRELMSDRQVTADGASNAEHLLPVLARHGQTDLALEVMTHLVEAGSLEYDVLRLNPHLEPLRDDPRFMEALAQAGTVFQEVLDVLETARHNGQLPGYLEQPLADLVARLELDPAR